MGNRSYCSANNPVAVVIGMAVHCCNNPAFKPALTITTLNSHLTGRHCHIDENVTIYGFGLFMFEITAIPLASLRELSLGNTLKMFPKAGLCSVPLHEQDNRQLWIRGADAFEQKFDRIFADTCLPVQHRRQFSHGW